MLAGAWYDDGVSLLRGDKVDGMNAQKVWFTQSRLLWLRAKEVSGHLSIRGEEGEIVVARVGRRFGCFSIWQESGSASTTNKRYSPSVIA